MFPAEEWESRGITVGRYLLHRQIARGGMATIHIARLLGDEGFSRIVAAKRLLPEFAQDGEFVTMFLDEARVASKVHHRNVVPVLDVVATGTDVILVQEYVHGIALNLLLREARQAKLQIPVRVAVAIATQVLAGLHAAHTTTDEVGTPLNIVHRDVSPHNIMIAMDGTARLLDFGVAKASMAAHVTRENTFKGKLAYSAPEQLNGAANRQSDVYSVAVTLWEMIVGRRMYMNLGEREIAGKIMMGQIPTLTEGLAAERDVIDNERWQDIELLEPIVKKGLAVELADRWPSAAAMESALTHALTPATPQEVADWSKQVGKDLFDNKDKVLAAEEASWRRRSSSGFTPVPGSFRRSSTRMTAREDALLEQTATTPEMPSVTGSRSRPQGHALTIQAERKRLGLAIAIGAVGALAVMFVILMVVTRHSSEAPAANAPAATTTPPIMTTPPPPAPAVAAPVPAPTPPPPPPPQPAVTAPPPSPAPPVEETPPPKPKPPVTHTITKKANPPPPPPVKKQPPPPPQQQQQETAPPPSPPPPVKNCNPPYYYEGKKKVFKPECV